MSGAERRQTFTFELVPSQHEAGGYHWAIRKQGKLVQRSDTARPTDAKARVQALAMTERLRIGRVNW